MMREKKAAPHNTAKRELSGTISEVEGTVSMQTDILDSFQNKTAAAFQNPPNTTPNLETKPMSAQKLARSLTRKVTGTYIPIETLSATNAQANPNPTPPPPTSCNLDATSPPTKPLGLSKESHFSPTAARISLAHGGLFH